jgi:hypothetical protein
MEALLREESALHRKPTASYRPVQVPNTPYSLILRSRFMVHMFGLCHPLWPVHCPSWDVTLVHSNQTSVLYNPILGQTDLNVETQHYHSISPTDRSWAIMQGRSIMLCT